MSASAENLAAWCDDGGTVEIKSLALHWGTLTVDAKGTLSLDHRFRPIAALSATVRGHRALVDSLVRAGTIRPAQGARTKITLDVFSDPANGGSVTIPVTVQDGWFNSGPLQVFRLSLVVSFPGAGSQSQSPARRVWVPRPGLPR